ncbi:MAG TPA: hypothetical protein DCE41_35195 [Cytophagales bacterium]|nr:hypothetical protein [Cytophagales bacterium]HAA20057.1 hypothetical protein [Cytophagales bacterium]HAP58641.1 hypothetical protein [Cytophagales bacterium]
MKLKNLITQIQTDIVDSQWESYRYSEQLQKEQAKGSLFPIPIARATSLELTLQFAFQGKSEFDKSSVFNRPRFLGMLRQFATEWYRKAQEGLEEAREPVNYSATGQPEASEGSQEGAGSHSSIAEMQRLSITKALEQVKDQFDTLMGSGYRLNRTEFVKTLALVYANYLSKYLEMKNLSWEEDRLKEAINAYGRLISADLDRIDARNASFVEEVETVVSPIMVDAESLQKLPPEVIQKAVLHISLDDIDDLED